MAVVFMVTKDTGEFIRYHIVLNKTENELSEIILKHNSDDSKKDRAYIVTVPHVVAALEHKESAQSVKDYAKDVKEGINDLMDVIRDGVRSLETLVESMCEFIKDNFTEEQK